MLDFKFIRENPQVVENACLQKKEPNWVPQILDLDRIRRIYTAERDQLRNKLNELSKLIAQLSREGKDIDEAKKEAKFISDQVKELEENLGKVELDMQELLSKVPNIPHPSVPIGKSSDDNKIVREWGKKPEFNFEPKDHLQLNEKLKFFDLPRGAEITGSFFPIFIGKGAQLVRKLINFMLDTHTQNNKYTEVWTPILVNKASMIGTAQLPKLEEDMYHLDREDYFLIPTGEVPLTNLHRNEILSENDLPKYYCAYTPCFRREAGSYGAQTRGLIRLHQFDKVELVKIVHPETSYDELEKLVEDAENILRILGLHYRVVLLCTADMTFASAKTYDIEVWAPGTKKWLEVSSVSNFEDFQARRMNTRFRPNNGGKPQFVHTLNGSAMALPRLIIALMETYQTAESDVQFPMF